MGDDPVSDYFDTTSDTTWDDGDGSECTITYTQRIESFSIGSIMYLYLDTIDGGGAYSPALRLYTFFKKGDTDTFSMGVGIRLDGNWWNLESQTPGDDWVWSEWLPHLLENTKTFKWTITQT